MRRYVGANQDGPVVPGGQLRLGRLGGDVQCEVIESGSVGVTERSCCRGTK